MARPEETAYPQLNPEPSKRDLETVYTPTDAELDFVRQHAKPYVSRVGMLLHLKMLQRLGYFVALRAVPEPVFKHIVHCAQLAKPPTRRQLQAYDDSGTKQRHQKQLREHLGIKVLDESDTQWLETCAREASESKEAIVDIINVLLEELVRANYELPPFGWLNRLAQRIHAQTNNRLYAQVADALSNETKAYIDELLIPPAGWTRAHWSLLKQEPKRPTNKAVREYLAHVAWLQTAAEKVPQNDAIPIVKRRQMLLEARALDAGEMRALKPRKRYALAALFLRAQRGKALDFVANLLIRLYRGMEATANQDLAQHKLKQAQQIDELVARFKGVLQAYESNGSTNQRFSDIATSLGGDAERLLLACDEHLAYADNNYRPFLLKPYRVKRALLFTCIDNLELQSTSEDDTTLRALAMLKGLQRIHKQVLDLQSLGLSSAEELRFLLPSWRRLVHANGRVDRRFFELAVFDLLQQELRSGDLTVVHGEQFDDYRHQLVDPVEYAEEIAGYGELVDLPTEPKTFVQHLKDWMVGVVREVDAGTPENAHFSLDNGRLVLHRARRAPPTQALEELDEWLSRRMGSNSIVDILVDAERWLNLHRFARPISGHDTKLSERRARFVSTVFCFGCNLGPVQTSRSVKGFSRRQIAWLNIKHITEDRLDKMITEVVNAFAKFDLPNYWGSGRHAAADGTMWDTYQENVMSEYHVRYGGYGGIGYYHVSDKYIALFSHFIPCGVHEAIYILDGLMRNESDIQPDVIHGDTHAQSYPVFGLSYLLGIELMPRIRDIKELMLYRPDKRMRFNNIESLLGDSINWRLIEVHLPDMLRVAVSIKLGRISASTILQRLGTHSRKNKVYFAFKELGKVVRTVFLLRYISDLELRQTIHAATNKCEEFNGFAKWVFFGGEGIIAENVLHEQTKITKYNHLVANLLILFNVVQMTQALARRREEGHELSPELLAGLSPYRTSHINRFGDYTLNVDRKVEPFDPTAKVL